MPVELLLPGRRVPAPPLPTYVKLAEAFGVGAGTSLFDKSRYRSHGAITTATWAAGLHGYCLQFVRATPDYVVIPAAHTQLNFTTEDFSIIMRVLLNTVGIPQNLYCRGLTDTDGFRLLITPTDRLQFFTYQALVNQDSYTARDLFAIATWYTFGISRDGASVRLYINGVDATFTAGVHIHPLTSARSAKIGIYDDLVSNPLNGKIEFLRAFGGIALAASEQLAWHNALA